MLWENQILGWNISN